MEKVVSEAIVALNEIDPNSTVLLLGSGFSLGCTNLRGKSPPNGSGLRRHFLDLLGLPPRDRLRPSGFDRGVRRARRRAPLSRIIRNISHIGDIPRAEGGVGRNVAAHLFH